MVLVGGSGTGGSDITGGGQGLNEEQADDGNNDGEGGDTCMDGNKGAGRGIR